MPADKRWKKKLKLAKEEGVNETVAAERIEWNLIKSHSEQKPKKVSISSSSFVLLFSCSKSSTSYNAFWLVSLEIDTFSWDFFSRSWKIKFEPLITFSFGNEIFFMLSVLLTWKMRFKNFKFQLLLNFITSFTNNLLL